MKYTVMVEAFGHKLPPLTIEATDPETAASLAEREAAFARDGSLKNLRRYHARSVKHRGVELMTKGEDK